MMKRTIVLMISRTIVMMGKRDLSSEDEEDNSGNDKDKRADEKVAKQKPTRFIERLLIFFFFSDKNERQTYIQ